MTQKSATLIRRKSLPLLIAMSTRNSLRSNICVKVVFSLLPPRKNMTVILINLPLALKKEENFVQTTNHLNNTSFLAPAPAPAPAPRVSHNKVSEKESEFKGSGCGQNTEFCKRRRSNSSADISKFAHASLFCCYAFRIMNLYYLYGFLENKQASNA
ncbi:hypothetical protein IGI04_006337 [Brassica rapa subsp. trilocularis]|uniref:Uncharacterized protein n=1 Tax=Brassica rapa subsp. trilocularis TaxID=1813537 RepID=A0ABQ7NGM0_BRACM|nr:hypothetical protein IGI04_006337 [Brassica rapa subsp. trilocularis]